MPDVKFEIKTILQQGIHSLRNFDCGNYKLFLKNDLGSLAGTLTGLWQTNSNQREVTLQDTKQGKNLHVLDYRAAGLVCPGTPPISSEASRKRMRPNSKSNQIPLGAIVSLVPGLYLTSTMS